jgi:predicted membrane-bound spermidine synthase
MDNSILARYKLRRQMIILLLFFCSGATSLVYEVIWSKYLALLFGSTIQAQTVVLAVFMGGLALGNKLFGMGADRSRRPLAIYGCIEVAIGLYAFSFASLYAAADSLFAFAGSRLLDHSGWLLLFKGVLSVLLLGGPTILMGGTLPVLAAWLQRNMPDAGRRSARFYSTNSLGAVCGAGLAGFFLVRRFGLPMTLKMSAIVNLAVGLIAIGIGKMQEARLSTSGTNSGAPEAPPERPPDAAALLRWGCFLVALTGAVSMSLEVLASRCLCLIFGASLQVFAIVLMAFILGIGLGSAVVASPRWQHGVKAGAVVVLLLIPAVLIGLVILNIENVVQAYRFAQNGLNRTLTGYCYHQIITAGISICFLGLPAAALGSVLPLWFRVVSATSDPLGSRVGRLLTWNTLGAVGGVLLTGFVLMPKIGLRGSFNTMALVLAVAAIITALATRRWIATVAGVVVGVFLAQAAMKSDANWRYVLSSGIFRLPDEALTPAAMLEWRKTTQLVFYEDAADATVSVTSEENDLLGSKDFVLRINGKPDASAFGDLPTQLSLAELPLIVRPDSKDVFCFGMGSGITAESTLGYPIEHLTIAENCEPVLRAVKLFAPWNHGVFTNSRVRIYREDARTVLKLSGQKYDVIISEPSNPWMTSVGGVFNLEFYQLAARRLKPGGIMMQWFHVYEMDDATLDLVLRTFGTAFPSMEIWDIGDQDVVLLGSNQPWESSPAVYQRAFELAGPHRDLTTLGLLTPNVVLARQFASQQTAFAIAGPGPVQSDHTPILEYDAPRAFYMYHHLEGVQRLKNFDERTWQVDIAPVAKNKVLAGLDKANLDTIFCQVAPSINSELETYLQMQAGRLNNPNSALVGMPCIFRGTNSSLLPMFAAAVTNGVGRQLLLTEAALRNNPTNQPLAVEAIKNILDKTQAYKPQTAGWSAAYYADLAVKVSLRLGNIAEAKAILLRGLQLEPDSEQLAYLSRILVREGILQPADLAPFTKTGGKLKLTN